MPNNKEPESPMTQETVYKKISLLKFLIPLLILLIIMGLVFLFKDRIFDLLDMQKAPKISDTVSNEVVNETGSPFGSMVGNGSNDKGDYAYLDEYNYYAMSSQGSPYKFLKYEDGKIFLKNFRGDNPEEIVSYSLSTNYVILCTKFDVVNVLIDFSRYSDEDKINVAKKSLGVSVEKKETLLKNYLEGSGVGVTFSPGLGIGDGGDQIIKLMLVVDEPEECYR